MILVDADDRLDWLFLAHDYADNLNVLSIMIDPPLARLPHVDRPALGFALTERDREEQIQFVIDLRRAIDLLEARPDVDPGRIGVRAWGVGAEYGALLAGVEDRVRAYQLVDLVGGPVTFFNSTDPTDPDTKAFWDLTAAQREAWLRAMAPIEPVYYIGQASPAYLLFQLEDREFFRDNSRLLLDVASEPKDVRWLPHPHGLSECAHLIWPHLGR